MVIIQIQEKMKVTDCFWEQRNLNRRTIEISIEANDTVTEEQLKEVYKNYEYVVVKCPVRRVDINTLLSDLGFVMIECQYRISKLYQDFNPNDELLKPLLPRLSFKKAIDKEDFDLLVGNVTPGMFTTDRIALDPHFGIDDCYRRYKNWMTTEFESQKSNFLLTYCDNDPIGFAMYKKEGEAIDYLLGGIYKKYQGLRYGILTPLQPFAYAYKDKELCFTEVKTSISSNNPRIVELYNYLNFRILTTTYIFVKHQTPYDSI